MRPNEKFSGRGHARHLCKECGRLGKDELAYRQAARDLERLLGFDGVIRRRQRAAAERFLGHANPRVREHAREVIALSDQELQRRREERWQMLEDEEQWCEAMQMSDEDDELPATLDSAEHDKSASLWLDDETPPF